MKRRASLDTFKGRLLMARRDLGLTQGDVADALGKSRATVTNWETGLSTPCYNTSIALAAYLKCDPGYLMYGSPQAPDTSADAEKLVALAARLRNSHPATIEAVLVEFGL